jgi:hypothetical protein
MSILDEANDIVNGPRRDAYGHPLDNHSATAEMWTTYLRRRYGTDILVDAEDVCWLNVLQKVVRDANVRARDNRVDVVGFTANLEMVESERKDRLQMAANREKGRGHERHPGGC